MFKRILSRISTLAVVAGSVLAPSALRAQEALLEETFADGSLGLWRAVSVASNEDWEASERDGLTFAEANGFGADEPSDDWLVSPVIDFDLSTGEVLTFDSIRGFSGPDLEILVSTDYAGGADPSTATWEAESATLSGGDFDQVGSGDIDLSSVEGTGYIAFRYKADGTGAGEAALWRVTNIKLVGALEGGSFPQVVPADPPAVLATEGDIEVRNGGYGSGMAKHPQLDDVYYLLTDRGPNINGPNSGEKIFPTPGFNPQIGRFRLVDGQLVKEGVINLKNAAGREITGLPNQIGSGDTGETPIMLDGTGAGRDFDGLDSEGLVALPDGTFWVSDEYGPHMVHFNVDGTTLERINPFSVGRAIPRVLGNRRPNRGMEGLTITPDRRKLVGIMQSSLDNPTEDRAVIRKHSRVTRIVVFDLLNGESEEYVYLQEKAALSNSEIRAISDTKFVVLERDGAFPEGPGSAIKRFYEIDLTGATNVTDPANHYLGMMVNGKTLEQLTDEEFAESGIVPVSKKIVLDLLTAAPGYPHDKPEGFEMLDDGVFAIINDDDFAINTDDDGVFIQKVLPANGEIDGNVMYFVKPAGLSVDIAANMSSGLTSEGFTFTPVITGGTGTLTYSWDFGDGNDSDEAEPTHFYAEGGTYTVSITVTDELGNEVSIDKADFVTATLATEEIIPAPSGELRVATFNASLNRGNAGDLIADLSTPDNTQAQQVAEIIQLANADVILVNEFDYDEAGEAVALFKTNYLEEGQNGLSGVEYPFVYLAPSNTGIDSGFDLDNNGEATGSGNDAFGFGNFPGQYGMVLFSKYPILEDQVRTFQNFLWKDMPDNLIPADWYSAEELEVFRLSSKSHWDVPVQLNGKVIHILASHPTPPVFDGAEDRNGTRNHDEIRLWADYVDPAKSSYLYDDLGVTGGLAAGESFVILGDQNADPNDGDSTNDAINQLLGSTFVNASFTPNSAGGAENNDGGNTQTGNPAEDTASFNLRADYALPSNAGLRVSGSGVFWPVSTDVRAKTVSAASDHRLVYVDLSCKVNSVFALQILHSSDNESSFQDPNTLEPKVLNYASVTQCLEEVAAQEGIPSIHVTAGDHTLPGPFYQAAAEADSKPGLADIGIFNALGLTANGMGNHEFDGGIDEFATMLDFANYPFLAVNLDFSNVQLQDGTPAIEIGVDGGSVVENAGKVAKSAYVEVGGEKIGLIGRAPADFFNVISDPARNHPGLDFVGGRDPETNQPLASAVGQVLEQVAILEAQGINKILLLDHAQDFTGDPLSTEFLTGIDIIVSAGSTGFMAGDRVEGPFNLLRPGDSGSTAYPTTRADADGNPVLVVNSEQLYRYVGNLIVGFDANGIVDFVDSRSGPVATTEDAVTKLREFTGLLDTFKPIAQVQAIWDSLQGTPLIQRLFEVVGTTSAPLNGLRADVRSRETNLGRLAADSTLWFAGRHIAQANIPFDGVDIALKNGGGIRDTIAGPNVTRLAVSAALAFDNKLAIVEVTAAELLATMENAVSRFPARDGRFPQLAGVFFEFDPSRPGVSDQRALFTGTRVGTLVVTRADGSEDAVVENFQLLGDPHRTFVLATNNFLLTGGDGYRALKGVNDDPNRPAYITDLGEQDILSDYIADALGGSVDMSEPLENARQGRWSSGRVMGSYFVGQDGFDESAAEILDYSYVAQRFFVVNGNDDAIDVLDARDPSNLTLVDQITDLGGAANSLSIHNGVLAVAVQNEEKTEPGWVVFYDTVQLDELNRLEVGVLPDMLTFTPDGKYILTANEAEPNDDYTVDPHGSVSIIDFDVASIPDVIELSEREVTTIGFEGLDFFPFLGDVFRANGIRIFGQIQDEDGDFLRPSSIAEDFEPEYIAISGDSKTAYVVLQENNVLAVYDIESKTLLDLKPLGYKDHSLPGNGFDASNRDGEINIKPWPTLGMYQPDAIESFESHGQTFLITANEGDSRDYDGYSEEERVKDLNLDSTAYPDADFLQSDGQLGRLKTTSATGDTDGDGDIDQIYSYGARSFSIWDSEGDLVFDSGQILEEIVAERFPEFFNASNDGNSFDNRSDDKGPEPEGIAVGEIDGRQILFLGLERMGGFMMFDITFPYSPVFLDYVLERDFTIDPEDDLAGAGDLGPEGLKFLSPDISPTGTPLVAVANEVSGTTTLYEIVLPPVPGGFALQVLHSSDNESAFQDPNTLEPKILNYATVVEGLKTVAFRERFGTLHLTAGDHTLPGPFYQASGEVEELGHPGLADIAFYNAMGLTANGIGNHEFDGGINEFAQMLAKANYPFIAANLDLSNAELEEGTPSIEIGEDGGSVDENAGKIVRSAYVEVNGEKIGLIGRAPADFFNVIADPDTTMPGVDFYGGRNPADNQALVSAVGQVLEQVALLEGKGINKIILLDHAQDFTADPLSAQSLRGIDIVVAAGSTGFMANENVQGPFNLLRPGDAPESAYPTVREDSEGNTVVVVNSDQLYTYVGNLMVTFDAAGHISRVDDRSGPVATTTEAIALLEDEINVPVETPSEVQRVYDLLQGTDLISTQFEVVGSTAYELNGARADVRSRETNLGRLAADSTLWFARDTVPGTDVDIALKNGGGIRSTILGPNITRLTIGAALAFNNRLAIVEITGDELLATMENAVSRVPALDGRFPQLAGVTLEYDPSKDGVSDAETLTTASRVKTLIVTRANGEEDVVVEGFVPQGDLSRTFVLATNNFLLTGGDGYRALKVAGEDDTRMVTETELGEQSILANYIIDVLGGEVDLPDPSEMPRVVEVSSDGPAVAAQTQGYEQWRRLHFGNTTAKTGPQDDFDGDGQVNLHSFAFGIDPTSGMPSDLTAFPAVRKEGNWLYLNFSHTSDPLVSCACEFSANLIDWEVLREDVHYEMMEDRVIDDTRYMMLRLPIEQAHDGAYFRVSVN